MTSSDTVYPPAALRRGPQWGGLLAMAKHRLGEEEVEGPVDFHSFGRVGFDGAAVYAEESVRIAGRLHAAQQRRPCAGDDSAVVKEEGLEVLAAVDASRLER